ncbi:MAG: DUF6145 family protein [Lachnospiraceae bacterium]|nr:DUF6145 family protein [Lachnospiraceae bacterium]
MDISEEEVLCGSSAYDRKYYFNPKFSRLPEAIQQELKVLCVLFTEEVGGIFELLFDESGELLIRTDSNEGDLLYDEIGAGLLVKEIRGKRQELFASLSLFYRVVFLGQKIETDEINVENI